MTKHHNKESTVKEPLLESIKDLTLLKSISVLQDKIYLECSNLADLIQKVHERTKEGYNLDYEHNDTYPIHYGYFFKVGMVKPI